MNLSDLSPDITLNILEYESNEYLNVDTDSLIERIQQIDPLFQLHNALSSVRKRTEGISYISSCDSYQLYKIFREHNVEAVEISEDRMEIVLCRVSNDTVNSQIKEIYPLISPLRCSVFGNEYTTLLFDEIVYFKKIVEELSMIHQILYGIFDPLNMIYMFKYENKIMENIIPAQVQMDTNENILKEIYLLDPSYTLYSELTRVLEIISLKKRLHSSPYYSIWNQIKDCNWHISIIEDEILLSVTGGPYLQFPSYVDVSLTSNDDENEYILTYPEGTSSEEIKDIILLNVLHNPLNMTISDDEIILPAH